MPSPNYLSPLDNSNDSPLPLGFTEFKDSGTEDFDFDAGEVNAVRIFDGPWENRHRFLFENILATVSNVNGENVFSDPSRYPDIPNATAFKASIKGLLKTGLGDEQQITHELARITVSYKTHSFSQDGSSGNSQNKNNYIEESLDTSTELLPLAGEKISYKKEFSYDDGNVGQGPQVITTLKKLTEEVHFNYIVKHINYKLRIPIDLAPRWGAITAALGTVNMVPIITPSGLMADRFRLRYDGISGVTKREISAGVLAWELTHSFSFYAPGWNTRPRINDDGELEHAAIIPKLYQYYDHRLIFRTIAPNQITLDLNAWFTFRNGTPLGQAFLNGTLSAADYATILNQFNHFNLRP